MIAVNKVILLGPVYQIKSIETKTGKDMIAFTLKTWRPMGKLEDGTKREDKKSWHKVVAYGNAAKVLTQYLEDGKIIYLEGSVDYYKDKDSVERTQIVLESFSFVGDNQKASE
jgi:single-strand DNA-binding protein